MFCFFFQAEDGIRDLVRSRGLGDVYKRQAVVAAAQVANTPGRLVTLGITPAYPETGYGYVERGPELVTLDGMTVYRVLRFTEKPSRETAARFVESGYFSWNSGMFIWRVDSILAVSYTHLRAHETVLDLVCRLLLEKKKNIRDITLVMM